MRPVCVLALLALAGCSQSGGKDWPEAREVAELEVAQIAVGSNHACARTPDGRVACWGDDNGYGQLGAGPVGAGPRPLDVRLKDIVEIAAGFQHTCARTGAGALFCWGEGGQGALGDGARTNRDRPTRVPLDPVARVFASVTSTCARLQNGSMRCWGRIPSRPDAPDAWGSERPEPTPTEAPLAGPLAVAVGGHARCAVIDGGAVRCWGDDALVLTDPAMHVDRPVTVTLPRPATALAMDVALACARLDSSEVYCWGHHTGWWLGSGGAAVRTSLRGEGLTGGRQALCSVSEGRVWCIGEGGVVIDGETAWLSTDAVELPLEGQFVSVEMGVDQLCGVRADHSHVCVEVREPPVRVGQHRPPGRR